MNPKDMFNKWFETYYGPAAGDSLVLHSAIVPTDLSSQSMHFHANFSGASSYVSLTYPPATDTRRYLHFDPLYLQGTPWGAAADRFEEAVAAAGTELEWELA